MNPHIYPKYTCLPNIKIGQSKREYPNKNANIEYYTDEEGNIRKRKKV